MPSSNSGKPVVTQDDWDRAHREKETAMTNTITLSRADLYNIVEEANVGFYEELDSVIRLDYSGGYMFDRQCVGFVVRDHGFSAIYKIIRTMVELDHIDEEDALALVENMREDNMGMSYIYYFPRLVCSDASVEDLYDALIAAGHEIEEMEGDEFAVRGYAEAINFEMPVAV